MTVKELETRAKENKNMEVEKKKSVLRDYLKKLFKSAEDRESGKNCGIYDYPKDYTVSDIVTEDLIESIIYEDSFNDVAIVNKIKDIFKTKEKDWREFAY